MLFTLTACPSYMVIHYKEDGELYTNKEVKIEDVQLIDSVKAYLFKVIKEPTFAKPKDQIFFVTRNDTIIPEIIEYINALTPKGNDTLVLKVFLESNYNMKNFRNHSIIVIQDDEKRTFRPKIRM